MNTNQVTKKRFSGATLLSALLTIAVLSATNVKAADANAASTDTSTDATGKTIRLEEVVVSEARTSAETMAPVKVA